MLVFPFPQSLEYDFPRAHGLSFQVLAQIMGILALLGVGLYLARLEEWRVEGLAILAFFILLAPTSSIIPSLDAAFEHRLYLPMLAFSVLAASLIARAKRPEWIAIPLVVALSIMSARRGTVWASEVTLWEDAVRHAPNKARAWFNLGGAYLNVDPDRARPAYTRALALQPDFAEAHYNLGVIEQTKANYLPAVEHYQRTVELKPGYWAAWNNLGNCLLFLDEKDRALNAFETTLRLNPDHWPSQYNIAIVHFNSGRFDQAIPRLRTVLNWRPDFRDARYLLAVALSRTGQQAEAEREWRKIGKNVGQPPMPATIPAPAR